MANLEQVQAPSAVDILHNASTVDTAQKVLESLREINLNNDNGSLLVAREFASTARDTIGQALDTHFQAEIAQMGELENKVRQAYHTNRDRALSEAMNDLR